jgi:arylformamidase
MAQTSQRCSRNAASAGMNSTKRAALWAEYDVEADVARHQEFRRRYREASEPVYASHACQRNISYGSQPRQTFDFFPGAGGERIFIFIHGGYWKAGRKDDRAFLAPSFLAAGVSFITLEYPIRPDVRFSEIVETVGQFWDALPVFLKRQGIVSPSIVLAGHSAGAHLAATSVARLASDAPIQNAIKGLVLLSGLFDLAPLRQIEIQKALDLDEVDVATLSPMKMNHFGNRRFLVAAGGNESEEFKRQSHDFHEHLRRIGCDSRFLSSPGDCHFSIVQQLVNPTHPLATETQRLLLS